MKKYFAPIFAICLILGLQSCQEEIEFTNSYSPTPVIFGLLDQADSIHFIKIQKGFLGPDDGFIYAQEADSNYFENVDAIVEELINNEVVRTWTLEDTLLNNKDTSGVFFAPEQKMYYFSTVGSSLDPEATYRLTVDINDGQLQVVGQTQLIDKLSNSNNLSSQQAQLRLSKDIGEYASANLTFSAGNSVFAKLQFNIVVNEFRGNDVTQIVIPWTINEAFNGGNNYSFSAQGETFYKTIEGGCTDDVSITKRTLEGFEAVYTGGSQEFYNYIQVNKPSSSLAQTKPEYTNLSVSSGFKVIGLFSSRQTVKLYKSFVNGNVAYIRCIDKKSTRELCFGEHTNDLLFCSQHPGDNNLNNPEDFACN